MDKARNAPVRVLAPTLNTSTEKRSGDDAGAEGEMPVAKRTKSSSPSKASTVDQRKAIEQLHPQTGEVLRIYAGGSDAAKFMGISQGGISLCCHGKQSDASGFKWRFYDGPAIDWNDPTLESRQAPLEQLKAMVTIRSRRRLGSARKSAKDGASSASAGAGGASAMDDEEDDEDEDDDDEEDDDELIAASRRAGAAADAASAPSSSSTSGEKRPKGRAAAAKGDAYIPTRAPSAYLHFCMESRPHLTVSHPAATFAEVGTMLGKMWGELDEAARQPYVTLHEESKKDLKARHERESSSKKGERRSVGGAGGADASVGVDGGEASVHLTDQSALVEVLRRELKACKEELKRSSKAIERLTQKVTDLRRTKHTVMKREKRLVQGKEKSLVRKEKSIATEAFLNQLKDLKQKTRKDPSVRQSLVAAEGLSSSSSSSSSGGAEGAAGGLVPLALPVHPTVLRMPPKILDNVNPTNRQRTREGPLEGENRWGFIKRAMLQYHHMYGTFHPPNSWVIPWEDEWLEEYWGYALGQTVNSIRGGHSYIKKREELEDMGFSYLSHLQPKYEREYNYSYVREALVRYQQLKGHVRPRMEEACEGEEWPENFRGFRLGQLIPHIRAGRIWKDMRADLESIGFTYPAGAGCYADRDWAKYDFPFVKRLLLHYNGLHGNLRIQRAFVVPATTAWPYDMHGVELGKLVEKIRSGLKKFREHREEFALLGLDFDKRETGDWERVKAALDRFKELTGHVDVERLFVVPSNTAEWPEATWGMKLGLCVENIQRYNNYKKYRGYLEGLGIKYGSRDGDGKGEKRPKPSHSHSSSSSSHSSSSSSSGFGVNGGMGGMMGAGAVPGMLMGMGGGIWAGGLMGAGAGAGVGVGMMPVGMGVGAEGMMVDGEVDAAGRIVV